MGTVALRETIFSLTLVGEMTTEQKTVLASVIAIDKEVMHGTPCFTGTRVPVQTLIDFLETGWKQPDEGIWEVRGPRRHFTHSKVMAWVAFDRAVKAVTRFRCEGPVDRWRKLRAAIHEEVCRHGFDSEIGAFVQYYGAKRLDASLLMIPLVGFLPASGCPSRSPGTRRTKRPRRRPIRCAKSTRRSSTGGSGPAAARTRASGATRFSARSSC